MEISTNLDLNLLSASANSESRGMDKKQEKYERAVVPTSTQNKRVFNVVNVFYIDRIRLQEFAVPPFFREHLRNVFYKEGKVVRFRCTIEGFPLPEIEWYKGTQQILEACDVESFEECIGYKYYASNDNGNLLLVITNILQEDFGPYTCKIRNTVGEARSTASLNLPATNGTNNILKTNEQTKRIRKKLIIEEKITIREKLLPSIRTNATLAVETRSSIKHEVANLIENDVMEKQKRETNEDTITVMFAMPQSCETRDIKVTSMRGNATTNNKDLLFETKEYQDTQTDRKFDPKDKKMRHCILDPATMQNSKSENGVAQTPESEGEMSSIVQWIKCGEKSDSEYRRDPSPYPIPRCLTENTDDSLQTSSTTLSVGNSMDETTYETNNKNEWLTSWRRKSGTGEDGSEEESKDTVGGSYSRLFSTGDVFHYGVNTANYEGRSAFADVFEDDGIHESKCVETTEVENGIATFSDISPLSPDSQTYTNTIELNPDYQVEDSGQNESCLSQVTDEGHASEDVIHVKQSGNIECSPPVLSEQYSAKVLSRNYGKTVVKLENKSTLHGQNCKSSRENQNDLQVDEDAARELDELIEKLVEFSQRNYVMVSSLKVGPSKYNSQNLISEEVSQKVAEEVSTVRESFDQTQQKRKSWQNTNFPMHPTDLSIEDGSNIQPHAPEFVIPLEDMEVSAEDNVVLNISVTGYPTPQITWFKDGLPLDEEMENGIIYDNLKRHCAIYTCVAENDLGQSKTSATVTIHQEIITENVGPLVEQSPQTDDEVKLRCTPGNREPSEKRRSQIISASLVDYLRWKAKLIQQSKVSSESLSEVKEIPPFSSIPTGTVDVLTRDDVTLRHGSMLSLTSISTTSFESADEGGMTSSDAVWEDVISTADEDFMSTDEFFFPGMKTNGRDNTASFFLTTPEHAIRTVDSDDDDDDLFNPRPLTPTPVSPNPPFIYEIATEERIRPFTRRPTDPRLLSADTSEEMETGRSENVTPVPSNLSQVDNGERRIKYKSPKFLISLKDVSVELGQPCSMTCRVVGQPEPDVAWYRNGIRILPPSPSSGKSSPHTFMSSISTGTPHQRFKITSHSQQDHDENEHATEYTSHELTISDCRSTDTGEYSVTAVNIYGNIISKAKISIKLEDDGNTADSTEFVSPHFVTPIKDSDGMIGEEATLTFQLSGQPEPDINIFHNREEVEEGKFSLSTDDAGTYNITIKDLQLEDEGEIRVCAMNVVGSAECSAELFVDERSTTPTPGKLGYFQWSDHAEEGEYGMVDIKEQLAMQVITPFFDVVTDDVIASVGAEASFAVRVLAWPAPDVFWYKGENEIQGERFRLESPDFGTHVLTIREVTEKDAGIYTCMVKNCAGDVSCKAELTVTSEQVTSGSSADEQIPEVEQRHVKDYYNIICDIGFGSYSLVRLVQDKNDELREFAAKYIRCSTTDAKEKFMSEVEILKRLSHENIVKYKDFFETKKHIILIMEYINIEWFEFLLEKDTVFEKELAAHTKDICCGLKYLHENNIVHLDMKPENIMVSADGNKLQIVDFGSSKQLEDDQEIKWNYGNPEFVSPEVVKSLPVSTTTDMWSLGVIVYVVISGISPFLGESDYSTILQVKDGKWHLDSRWFATVSEEVKDFINKLLLVDPNERLTAVEAEQHVWLHQNTHENDNSPLPDGRLKYFISRRKWQRSLVSPNTSLVLRSIESLLKREYDSNSIAVSRTLASEYISSSTMTESEDDVTPGSMPASPRFMPRSYQHQPIFRPKSPRKNTTSISIEDILEQETSEVTTPTVKIVDSTPKSSPTLERKSIITSLLRDAENKSVFTEEIKPPVENKPIEKEDVEDRSEKQNLNLPSHVRPARPRIKLQMIGKKVSFEDQPINPIVFEETQEMILCEKAEMQESEPAIRLSEQNFEPDLPPVAQMPELPVPEAASGPPGITLDRPQSVSQLLKEDRRPVKVRRSKEAETHISTREKIKKKLSSITSRRHRSFDVHSSSSEEDLRTSNGRNNSRKEKSKLSFFSRRKRTVVKGRSLDSSLISKETKQDEDKEEKEKISLEVLKNETENVNLSPVNKKAPIKGILKRGGSSDASSQSDPHIQKSLQKSRSPSPKIAQNIDAFFPKQYQRRPLLKGMSLDLDMVAEANSENGKTTNRSRQSATERRRAQLRRGSSAESALPPPLKPRVSGLRGPLLEKGGEAEDEPMAGMSLRRSLPGGAKGKLHNHSRSYSGPLSLHSPGFERGKFSPLALSPRGPFTSPMAKYSSLSRSFFSQSIDMASVRPSESPIFEERMTGKKSLSAQLPTTRITLPRSRSQDRSLGRRSRSAEKRLAGESYAPCLKVPLVDQGITQNQECVTLICLIDAYPLPEITWHKDGKEIIASDRIEIISEASITRFQLKIRNVKIPDDYGEYTCVARNTIGELQTACVVKLAVVPDKPSAPEFSGTDGTNVWVSWNPPNNCAPSPLSYVLQYREMAGMQWVVVNDVIKDTIYKVEKLRPTTSYRFRVSAANNAGFGPFSKVSQRIQINSNTNFDALHFAF